MCNRENTLYLTLLLNSKKIKNDILPKTNANSENGTIMKQTIEKDKWITSNTIDKVGMN